MLNALRVRRSLAPFAAAVAALFFIATAGAAPTSDARERAERLAQQAEETLNTWSGRDETIAAAVKLIQEALALDPGSGHAMVEKGRAILMAGATSRGYSSKSAAAAFEIFTAASQLEPPYGRAFVLLGHLHTETGNLSMAPVALRKADALVPNDPWLKLNWGAYYAAMGQPEKRLDYAEQAIATGTKNTKALVAAHELLLKAEVRNGNRAKSDAHYVKAAALQPANAWVRGNYARNVIMHFGDFDTGERLAREALAIMDYRHARETLSLAMYGRFAQAARDAKPAAEQDALFDAAMRNDPGGRYLPECAMQSKSVTFVFEAVARKGLERRETHRC